MDTVFTRFCMFVTIFAAIIYVIGIFALVSFMNDKAGLLNFLLKSHTKSDYE